MSRRVVVTGGSCISSLGMELDEIFTSLKSLKNRIVRMEDWDKYSQMNTRLAAPILYDLPEYPRKKIRGAGRVGLLALASADKAMQVAGLTGDTELLKSGRVGVAYGSSMGSVNPDGFLLHVESSLRLLQDYSNHLYPLYAPDLRREYQRVLWHDWTSDYHQYRMHQRKPFYRLRLRSH